MTALQQHSSGDGRPAGGIFRRKRWLPLAIILAAVAVGLAFDLDGYLTFETLRSHRLAFTDFVRAHGVLAVVAFIVVYSSATALSFPGATLLTVAGGFLFGGLLGTLWAVIGATCGAIAIFLAARSAIGDLLEARAGPFLQRMEAGFQENALNYMLFLRLVPVFPFVIVNLVPAFLGVSLRDYALATFVGIIPGAFVYASLGAGLGSFFDANEVPSLRGVLTPEILVAFTGLALLSLLPIALRRYRRRRSSNTL